MSWVKNGISRKKMTESDNFGTYENSDMVGIDVLLYATGTFIK